MRKGSVAIVPLFLAISLLFWFIWFMGSENDNLHTVNQIANLQHLQDRLALAAVQKRYELEEINPTWDKTKIEDEVSVYIHNIMKINQIDE